MCSFRRSIYLPFLQVMQDEVNLKADEQIEVSHLTEGGEECFQALKDGADSKTKSYCCLVWVSKVIDEGAARTVAAEAEGPPAPTCLHHRAPGSCTDARPCAACIH